MDDRKLIEINEITGPFTKSSEKFRIKVVNNGETIYVPVCDLYNLNNFVLVGLSKDILKIIELHDQGEYYVGGIFKIHKVFHMSDIVDNVHCGITYLRHVHVSEINNIEKEIENGNVFISSIEYPYLASDASEELVCNRFYNDAEKLISKKGLKFINNHNDMDSEGASALFKHNQMEVLRTTMKTVKAMNFFENVHKIEDNILEIEIDLPNGDQIFVEMEEEVEIEDDTDPLNKAFIMSPGDKSQESMFNISSDESNDEAENNSPLEVFENSMSLPETSFGDISVIEKDEEDNNKSSSSFLEDYLSIPDF